MFRRFFRKEKAIVKAKEYKIIVRWYHDEPLYMTTTNIGYWEANPEVRTVEVIG